MLLVALIAATTLGVTAAFSTSYVMFAVCRALCGAALSGMSIIGVALSKNSNHTLFRLISWVLKPKGRVFYCSCNLQEDFHNKGFITIRNTY